MVEYARRMDIPGATAFENICRGHLAVGGVAGSISCSQPLLADALAANRAFQGSRCARLCGLQWRSRNMHVADLAGGRVCTMNQPAIGEYTGGDAGSNSKKHKIRDASRSSQPAFSDGCESHIILYCSRHVQGRLQESPKRNIPPSS